MEDVKKDVWLSIHSVQHFAGCVPEKVDLATQARLYRKNGKYYIMYDESPLTGLEGTRTTLKIDEESVSMVRRGKYPSEMLFLENQRHVGLYQAPSGMSMTISTHTSRIENTLTEDGGRLVIDYTIAVDQNLTGRHHFELVVATQPFDQ